MLKLFAIYTWMYNIAYTFLDICPPIFRKYVFRLMLGACGKKTYIDYTAFFRYPKRIFVGNRVTINRGCQFLASIHTKDKRNIVIKDHVVIGPYSKFFAAGHDADDVGLRDTYGRITIEEDCWIGGNVTILQGVTVHKGSVVGAGSVVATDIPEWCVAVGNPAKVIRERKRKQKQNDDQL